MKTELKTYSIKEITKDFTYNEYEGKGLYGLSGQLVINQNINATISITQVEKMKLLSILFLKDTL